MTTPVEKETEEIEPKVLVPQDKIEKDAGGSEKGGEEENSEKHLHETSTWVPWGVTSFAALEAFHNAQESAVKIRVSSIQFAQMVERIMDDGDIDDKQASLENLSAEWTALTADLVGSAVKDTIASPNKKELFKKDTTPDYNNQGGFMVYKDTETGQYRWISRYSNNFRDKDNPPEIITQESHLRFVSLVDKGIAPLPELWLWHNPKWKMGAADWVAWDAVSDEVGFAVAGGHFDDHAKDIAETLAEVEGVIGVSHGMPKVFLEYARKGKGIIRGHITVEISPLPQEKAANKIADFSVITNKEGDLMAVPEEKKELIQESFGVDMTRLTDLEKENVGKAKKAVEDGIEFKEGDEEDSEAEDVNKAAHAEEEDDAKGGKKAKKKKKETAEEAEETVSMELVDQISKTMAALIDPLTEAIKNVAVDVSANTANIKDMQDKGVQAIETVDKNIPMASLAAAIGSRIIKSLEGDGDVVDKDDPILGNKPKEAAPERNSSGMAAGIMQDIITESENQ